MKKRLQLMSVKAACRMVVIAVLAVLSWSCGSDAPLGGEDIGGAIDNDAVYRAGFNIVVTKDGSASRASRMTPEGDYDPGKGYENYIDIDNADFRFLFFGSDNKYITSLNVTSVLPTGDNAFSKTYYVVGEIDNSVVDKTLKVVALANWGSDIYNSLVLEPGVTTIQDLCNSAVYDFDPNDRIPSVESLIPFFGVTNEMKLEFDALNLAKVGTIHMLRAYAKVELVLNETCPTRIAEARIHRYNSRGYCAPSGINSGDDYVHNNYDSDYANTPHVVDGAVLDEDLPFITVEEGEHYLIYVPEFKNIGVPYEKRSEIRVRFEEYPEDYYDVVYFKYYDNPDPGFQIDDPFDVLRNYWYVFTVSKYPYVDDIDVKVQMVPYNEVILDPSFGLDHGKQLIPVYDNDGTIRYLYDSQTGTYYYADEHGNILGEMTEPPGTIVVDPATGYSLLRDDNGMLIGYHNTHAALNEPEFYATNKLTPISDPFQTYDSSTGLFTICSENRRTIYYYVDRKTGVCYAPDGKTEVNDPFDFYNVDKNRIAYQNLNTNVFFGYNSLDDGKWYAKNGITEIAHPMSNIAPNGRYAITTVDKSVTFLYIDAVRGRYYAPDNATRILRPFDYYDPTDNTITYRNITTATTEFYYKFNLDTRKWFDRSGNVIPSPF